MSHSCPRPECSRDVPDDMFACRGDWYALPAHLRDAMWAAWLGDDAAGHAEATAEAIAWYRASPPRYARRGGVARR